VTERAVNDRRIEEPTGKSWLTLGLVAAVTLPGLAVRADVIHLPVEVEALLFGVAILGAAFLLSWAADVAQLDVPRTLAIASLAIIVVLPEYAVDLFLAFRAGQGDVQKTHLAVANMTGSNRLLIGIGWAAVVLVYWAKAGRREIRLRAEQRTDVGYLLIATVWAFTIPLRRQLSLLDLAILGGLLVAYIVRAAREEMEEPELIGVAALLGRLPAGARRVTTIGLFLFSAAVILGVAEQFADGLIEIGKRFNISQFLLIQWVAPLASEAPELIIAVLFTLRLKPRAGLGTLISSKVNQWTLLVGTLPLVFIIAGLGRGEGLRALPMDGRQVEEVFLTAAQSLFAVAVIANFAISRVEAVGLLVLFLGQFGFESSAVRYGFGFTYLALTLALLAFRSDARRGLWESIMHVVRPSRSRGGD
jgi:cation:H+ antiporter